MPQANTPTETPEASVSKFTTGPWQFVFGDIYDHGEDAHANGFTILMAGARLKYPEDDETVPFTNDRDRVGRPLVIHHVRYAEDIFPEDSERGEAETNARLIAAAPDLYEATEVLTELVDAFISNSSALNTIRPDLAEAWRQCAAMGRAALAKARGEG